MTQLAGSWVAALTFAPAVATTPDHFDTWIDEVALDDARIGCDL